jgi:hypothetical protein
MRIAILVLALGCGGGSKASTTPKGGVTCAAVADAMVGMMMEGKNQENAAETAEAFNTIIEKRCDADVWSPEARKCLAAMRTRADAEQCSTLLTDEQQANLVRDQKAKFGASSGATEQDAEAPANTTAPPPPSPMRSVEPKEQEAPQPKNGTKTRKTGDPCDGGE